MTAIIVFNKAYTILRRVYSFVRFTDISCCHGRYLSKMLYSMSKIGEIRWKSNTYCIRTSTVWYINTSQRQDVVCRRWSKSGRNLVVCTGARAAARPRARHRWLLKRITPVFTTLHPIFDKYWHTRTVHVRLQYITIFTGFRLSSPHYTLSLTSVDIRVLYK